MNSQQRLIHLVHCRGIGRRTIYRILRDDPTLNSIYNLTENDLYLRYHIPLPHAANFLHDLHTISISSLLNSYQNNGIYLLTLFDSNFPMSLAQMPDPPLVLFYQGKLAMLSNNRILSVVGTREPSSEFRAIMDEIIKPLVESGWTIVSGMALGIDTYAHQLGLKFKTVAVLGSGFYYIYPRQNMSLYHNMAKNHLVISEYPPQTRPQKHQFPERNRIISGLSWGTLVVEAREKSGSLITADQALESGREVFAIPGSILKKEARGTNYLIQQGAKLVFSSEDIVSEWKTIAKIKNNLYSIN